MSHWPHYSMQAEGALERTSLAENIHRGRRPPTDSEVWWRENKVVFKLNSECTNAALTVRHGKQKPRHLSI